MTSNDDTNKHYEDCINRLSEAYNRLEAVFVDLTNNATIEDFEAAKQEFDTAYEEVIKAREGTLSLRK